MNALLPILCCGFATALPAQPALYSTFATGCAGSMPPTHLVAENLPILGGALEVQLDNLPVNAAILVTGFSNSAPGLPLSLTPYGMPGCWLRITTDLTAWIAGTSHQAIATLAMPQLAGLLGFPFYQQAAVPDPLAGNAAQLVTSDAAVAWIGLASWPASGTPISNMVAIQPGTFVMGSYSGMAYEQAPHEVTITHPFWIGAYEVTQARFQQVMNYNPSQFLGAGNPVEQVSWLDAVAYCTALTTQEAAANHLPPDYEYRLPTEAEWEYCCRAGTTTEFNVGSTIACSQANFYDSVAQAPCVGATVPVGSYPPNAWGLYDMHGNVWEWCLDGWDHVAGYSSAAVTDPYVCCGPERIYRGGSHGRSEFNARCAARNGTGPQAWYYNGGFRVVLAPVIH
ncbi:MAG: formylglycine-generating enzyme family protein [Planctomycetota bacterium]